MGVGKAAKPRRLDCLRRRVDPVGVDQGLTGTGGDGLDPAQVDQVGAGNERLIKLAVEAGKSVSKPRGATRACLPLAAGEVPALLARPRAAGEGVRNVVVGRAENADCELPGLG